MNEIVAVAHALNIGVDAGFPQEYLSTSAKTSPPGTTVSTIRDVLNGSGKILRFSESFCSILV